MALNVNIIGRDSEGNLRALKVNSEGNLDFGQLETEIQAVKDNQGRLYGKYGEAWIPVKVDSEGRPILASDVTVNAEGMVVDLSQIKQGPAGTEPWLVQLSGTITELVLEQIEATYMIGQTLRVIAEGGATIADGKTIDASKYKEWFIHIRNSHEKEITLQLSIRSHGGQIISNTASLGVYPDTPIPIPAGASKVLTKDDIPQLGWAIPAFYLICRSSSPAQGSMDVRIYGRRW